MIEKFDIKITHQYVLAKHQIQLQDHLIHSMLFGYNRRKYLILFFLLGAALVFTVKLN